MTKEQAQKLLQLPDVETIKGLRVGFYITDYLRIPTGFAVKDFDDRAYHDCELTTHFVLINSSANPHVTT